MIREADYLPSIDSQSYTMALDRVICCGSDMGASVYDERGLIL